MADSPYIHSCEQPLYHGHLSIMATFFCPQGGHCKEVQLYTIILKKENTNPSNPIMLYYGLEKILMALFSPIAKGYEAHQDGDQLTKKY